jgi:oligoendopeptidase F
MAKERKSILAADKWAVEDLYESLESWQKEYDALAIQAKEGFAEFTCFRGCLSEKLESCLKKYFDISEKIEALYVYAHLRHDEDVSFEGAKKAYQSISMLYHMFAAATSWLEPEILQTDLKPWLQRSEYKNFLKKLAHQKPHVLSEKEERLLAASSDPLQSVTAAFSSINNADLKFEPAVDEKGKANELTHSSYQLYLKSQDRQLRKSAFLNMHKEFGKFQNTIADLLAGSVKKHHFHADARGYKSALEAALFGSNIPISVYYKLVETARANLNGLHDYIALRKKVMGLEEIHAYDMYTPLAKEVDIHYSFEEACDIILQSLEPLGKEYQDILRKGLLEERWVDRYENENKRSGAYSSGSYRSKPFILMNYKGTFSDLMTLTHEAGHSMHSYFSNRGNPFWDAQYTIFVAEVASTFHEELAFRYLYRRAKSKEEKIFILSQKIDSIRSTFFRQTMFAEFELKIHEMLERHEPLTPGSMRAVYEELNRAYFGPDFTYDDTLFYEYLRIPHFYSNFYVYQYATGLSAAFALVERVLNGGGQADYLRFLSSGGSDFPVELLKKAGTDMTTKGPVETLISRFNSLVSELKILLD